MTNVEHDFFRLAIEEARKSVDEEDGRIHPKVGVVVVKEGKVLASGHRGELEKGEHAEYTVLERKLKSEALAGATVYCTLEPCTTRTHPKVPCAERIADRKVGRVMIGMVDPNPEISGRGQQLLRQANIEVGLFPGLYASEIEEMNRDFSRSNKKGSPKKSVSPEWIKENRGRPLDEWYRSINVMYWNRNFYKSAADIFAHLVEVVGGLSLLASQKKKVGVKPETFVAKSVAWWLALCGRVGVSSVSELLWAKFPAICPYCHKNPHAPGICLERKKKSPELEWDTLSEFGKQAAS